MIPKFPRRKYYQAKSGLKFFLLAELAIFLSSYTVWAACNRSQYTRKFFHDTPGLGFVLEFYYRIGEYRGEHFRAIREFDEATWSAQAKLSGKKP